MKRKVRFIAALFCMGCLATEPAADIKAAGIQVAAAQTTLSADNSLEVLSLSAGTLSPDFTGKTVQYTATVPNDVTSVTVTATPVNEFATVQSITGNDNLQVGTNTIKVVVKAQNGALAQYTITLTREDGQTADGTVDQPADGTDSQTTDQPADGTDGQTTDQPADGTDGQAADQNAEFETEEAEDVSNMEYLQQEYNDLSEQYAKEKSFSRNMMGIMAFVIAVLVVIIINLLLRGRKSDDWDEEEDDWDWKSEKQGKDQEAEDDTDLEEDDNIEENPGVEEDDLEVDDPEDADWEEEETQRKGFFHRKPKEKVEEEPDDVEENDTENEVGVSKIHKVRAGLFGRGMSDDLDDEDWEEDEDFLPVERKKPEEKQRPERKEKPEEKQRTERKEKPEEKQRPERKEKPERKHTPEKKHIPREEEEEDDLEIIDLNDL
ncbi:cadherin-like beta sandwich domain-containing protein [Roseburia intestinalis]|uniref:cadherin-like beta sandwich domain-containing protein n=1 Tax=Roseburia intestinalis TaxID=166486 RepID=UPI00201B7501|nr:cadherin-like beta sandwich domain-containing protein [Roseburia intestinalis]MBD9181855.1 hypothetical protein [Roseburia intestinalis]UQT31460.1 cadherin-like beta sandwich domain-containing protein [Roseburia intestinalis]